MNPDTRPFMEPGRHPAHGGGSGDSLISVTTGRADTVSCMDEVVAAGAMFQAVCLQVAGRDGSELCGVGTVLVEVLSHISVSLETYVGI